MLVAHEAEREDLGKHLAGEDEQQRHLAAIDKALVPRIGRIHRRVNGELDAVEDDDEGDERLKVRALHQLDEQVARERAHSQAHERRRVEHLPRWSTDHARRVLLGERVDAGQMARGGQILRVDRVHRPLCRRHGGPRRPCTPAAGQRDWRVPSWLAILGPLLRHRRGDGPPPGPWPTRSTLPHQLLCTFALLTPLAHRHPTCSLTLASLTDDNALAFC